MQEIVSQNQQGSVGVESLAVGIQERQNCTDVDSSSPKPSGPCELYEPMEKDRHWNDRIERTITRCQSQLIETCLDAADNGVTIAPYTRDRLTNTAVLIYQFANKVLPPREDP